MSGIRARVEKSMAGCQHLWRRMRVVRDEHLVQVTQIRTRQFLQGYLLDVIGQKGEKLDGGCKGREKEGGNARLRRQKKRTAEL